VTVTVRTVNGLTTATAASNARVHRGRRALATDAVRVQRDLAPEDLVQRDDGVGHRNDKTPRNDATMVAGMRRLLLPPLCPSKLHFNRRTRASRR
jgi:hypothetical protein